MRNKPLAREWTPRHKSWPWFCRLYHRARPLSNHHQDSREANRIAFAVVLWSCSAVVLGTIQPAIWCILYIAHPKSDLVLVDIGIWWCMRSIYVYIARVAQLARTQTSPSVGESWKCTRRREHGRLVFVPSLRIDNKKVGDGLNFLWIISDREELCNITLIGGWWLG